MGGKRVDKCILTIKMVAFYPTFLLSFIRMKRKTIRVISIFLMTILLGMCQLSCQNKTSKQDKTQKYQCSLDTLNALNNYNRNKDKPTQEFVACYKQLFEALKEQNQIDVIKQHFAYFNKNNINNAAYQILLKQTEAYLLNFDAQYPAANNAFRAALKLVSKNPTDEATKAALLRSYGSNFIYLGQYDSALNAHLEALNIFEKQKDSFNIYQTQVEIAIDFYYQKEHEKAIANAQKCLQYFESHKNTAQSAYTQSVLATLYYNIGNYDSALKIGYASLENRKYLNDMRGIAESQNNLSLSYMSLGQWDKAAQALDTALQMMMNSKDERQIPIIKQNLAYCYWKLGDDAKAIQYLNQVVEQATAQVQIDALANANKKLYSIYKKQGKLDAALEAYKNYKSWSDSLYNIDKTKTINELHIKYESHKKEAQIEQLKAAQKLETTKKIVYLILLVSVSLIGILFYRNAKNTAKKNSLMVEKVQLELNANQDALNAFTQSILNKNKLIASLEEQLTQSQVAKAQPEPILAEDNEELSNLYQFKILTEEDWRQFKIHFDKVYPGFIQRLRAAYPTLAPAEERQFLLIKLNISNNEIADMLGISQASVKKNRYRLKKRFNLSEQEDLDLFVKTISEKLV